MDPSILSIAAGLSAMAVVALLAYSIIKEPVEDGEMLSISRSIEEGAKAFIKRQYRTIIVFSIIVSSSLWLLVRDLRYVASFLSGTFLSLLSAYIGMAVALKANVRTAYAAASSQSRAFSIALRGGGVMGLSVTGLSLLGVSLLLSLFGEPMPLVAFGFGASLSALSSQLGGGIFTKAADIGADLVGKIEQRIPEDDPRNPAVIADQVGDNVGDCAGRGSDLFESISDDYVTAILLGSLLQPKGKSGILFPLALGAVGVLSTIIGILTARRWRGMGPMASFNMSLLVTVTLCSIGAFISSILLLGDIRIFYSTLSGMAAMLIIGIVSQHYLSLDRAPVRDVARASEYGAAINIITGLSYALQSPFIPLLLILMSIIFSYHITGGSLYGIVGANLGTDLATGIIMTGDAFGPIADNAAGIAEMAGMGRKSLQALSELDSMGNTTKAYTKAFAAASGVFSTFVILATFNEMAGIRPEVLSSNPSLMVGVLLGGALPFLFSSLAIRATAKTAYRMVEEVRRQFREHPGILEGREGPDYSRCVDIAARFALSQMLLPGLMAVAAPALIGSIMGRYSLSAALLGGLASSSILSPVFTFGGGIWDNAKKEIEREFWMEGSPTHAAAVTGDTVGDPLKDVAGPSLTIFMKLMNMTALLIAPIIIS